MLPVLVIGFSVFHSLHSCSGFLHLLQAESCTLKTQFEFIISPRGGLPSPLLQKPLLLDGEDFDGVEFCCCSVQLLLCTSRLFELILSCPPPTILMLACSNPFAVIFSQVPRNHYALLAASVEFHNSCTMFRTTTLCTCGACVNIQEREEKSYLIQAAHAGELLASQYDACKTKSKQQTHTNINANFVE